MENGLDTNFAFDNCSGSLILQIFSVILGYKMVFLNQRVLPVSCFQEDLRRSVPERY